MCEVTTLAAVSLGVTALGGVATSVGQLRRGRSTNLQAQYAAQIQENNSRRAEIFARDALQRGEEAERQQRVKGRLLLGQMRAVLAGSGQVVDEGSAGDLVIDQAGVNELDALNVRANAEREAYSYRIRAADFQDQANLTRISGQNAQADAAFSAGGTLLGTTGQVAGKWYQFKRAGAFG